MHMNKPSSPTQNIIKGAFWTIGARWVIKFIGFINTIIMARILLPEDYGLVAAAMLAVGLLQTFMDFGATTALLRLSNPAADYINSAWTLKIIQGTAVSVAIIALSGVIGKFLQKPEIIHILWTFAVAIFLASLGNIGLTLAVKDFNFKLGAKIDVISKIASVAVTLSVGMVQKSHWALVMGIVAGYITPLVLSYAWHPYRPTWSTEKVGEIWKLTKWLLLASIGSFVLRKGDEIIASKIGTSHEYGLYNVGADLGQLPVQEIGPAMLKALLPVLSSMEDAEEYINDAIHRTTAAINTIIWPIALGFAVLSEHATAILLGPKWIEAAKYVYAFAIISALQTATAPIKILLTLRGHTRTQSMQVWREFAVFAGAAGLLITHSGLYSLAIARAIASITNLFDVLLTAKNLCRLDVKSSLLAIFRPLAIAAAMAVLVHLLNAEFTNPYLAIIISLITGGGAYTFAILVVWTLLGKPNGIESMAINQIKQLKRGKDN